MGSNVLFVDSFSRDAALPEDMMAILRVDGEENHDMPCVGLHGILGIQDMRRTVDT